MAVRLNGNSSTNLLNQDLLVADLQSSLRETVFSSGLSVSPRRINQIGQTIATTFVGFCEETSTADSHALGKKLALEGLGPRSVLAATETLRRVCFGGPDGSGKLTGFASEFVILLLEGYMHGREEQLLEVQERTHRAHLAALTRMQADSGRQE